MTRRRRAEAAIAAVALAGCATVRPGPAGGRAAAGAPRSRAADAAMIAIPGGAYQAGSSDEERREAYADYLRTAGHDAAARGRWFDREAPPHQASLPAFRIDRTPVTQAAYAEFVAAGGAPAPTMDEATWRAQRLAQDYAREVVRFVWRGGRPPPGRAEHPVVLVTRDQAAAYCAWRGRLRGEPRRLPTADEYERAARGALGRRYPWGDAYDPARLAGVDGGPRDTVPVDAHPGGASPEGVLGLAGNAFAWTSTPFGPGGHLATVKGSAWDDHGGVGRGAAGHGRPPGLRHVLVGFRCAADAVAGGATDAPGAPRAPSPAGRGEDR